MSKISEKQNSKRINILDAAYELFISKSFSSTSIDDIVRKAGIAKGTFYLYYKDKYDVMDRIVAHKTLAVLSDALNSLEEFKAASEAQISFPAQVLFVVNRMVDYMQAHKELLTLIDKKLSKCFSAYFSLGDSELKSRMNELVTLDSENGRRKDETVKKLYLIVDLVGSVCCDAVLYESPFKLSEIKPVLFSAVEKILA